MNQLIKITEKEGKQLVSARELHEFLEVKTKFTDWFAGRVKKYEFIKNSDFILVSEKKETNNPKNPISEFKDYAITVEMARKVIIDWKPNRELELMIKGCNAQIRM